jgi:hypothetical protein
MPEVGRSSDACVALGHADSGALELVAGGDAVTSMGERRQASTSMPLTLTLTVRVLPSAALTVLPSDRSLACRRAPETTR